MLDKISSSLSLASLFKGVLFKRLSSPMQTASIVNFCLELKKTYENEKDQAQMIFKILELVNDFKKNKPQDYAELFVILDEVLENFDENKAEFKKALENLLKN